MTPEIGDIWTFNNEYLRLKDGPCVLIERLEWSCGDIPGEYVFNALDLTTNEIAEYIFNDRNIRYWSKLA